MTHFEILSKLNPDIIAHFLDTGNSLGIPEDTQQWIKEIQIAYEVYNGIDETTGERNISKAAIEVRKRIIAELKIKISVRSCVERIYSALKYFHVDNDIPVKVWSNDFANKYEDLKRKAEDKDDFRTALACLEASERCRERASEASGIEAPFAPVFLIANDISLLGLGFKTKSLKEIARKHNEGFYSKFIEDLPIDDENKKRLRIDADLPETPYEEIEND